MADRTTALDRLSDTRLTRRFQQLKQQNRGGLVTFLTAGDPDPDTFAQIFSRLPSAGADVIEVGMPFSDPMADGPAIQAASQRALKSGMTVRKTLAAISDFRAQDDETPIILMGYYNPIYRYGPGQFVQDAKFSGVDGLIIVDLPPEEDSELCHPALTAGIHWIRMVTPTTTDERLPSVLENTSGFIYYVSITGITGTRSAESADVAAAIRRLQSKTDTPIAVGFGINTPEQIRTTVRSADAAVVGTALVKVIAEHAARGETPNAVTDAAVDFVSTLSSGRDETTS